jgi:hypothetical protein
LEAGAPGAFALLSRSGSEVEGAFVVVAQAPAERCCRTRDEGADEQRQGADQRESRSGPARRLRGWLGLLSRLIGPLQHGVDPRFRIFGRQAGARCDELLVTSAEV